MAVLGLCKSDTSTAIKNTLDDVRLCPCAPMHAWLGLVLHVMVEDRGRDGCLSDLSQELDNEICC